MNTSLKRKSTSDEKVFFADELYIKGHDHTQSPFRYPGGKFYALKYILPFLECYPHDEYREPFVGGGSVFFGKTKAQFNWLNDLEKDVITTYQAMQNEKTCERLIERVCKEVATKERHSEIKAFLPKTKEDVAFRTYYLNRTSYSGIIHKPAWGYAIGASAPPQNWQRFLKGANKKLPGVQLTSFDFSDVIAAPVAKGRSVLMYLDPPYFYADQKRAYTKSFVEEDHKRLAKQLRNCNQAFCLSYDDCKPIRDLYQWAYIYERSWFYNTANTQGARSLGKELIITNYKVVHMGQTDLFPDLHEL